MTARPRALERARPRHGAAASASAGTALPAGWRWGVVALAVLALVGTVRGFGTLDHCGSIACDFPTFHAQGRTVLAPPFRIAPGWKLPPFAAVVFAPLGLLPLGAATFAWEALNLVLIGVLAARCRRALRGLGSGSATWIAVALTIASLPVVHCFKWGQVSLLVAVLALLALESPGVASGPVIGALGAFKVYPIALLLGPACARAWRVVLGAALAALACGIVVPWIVLGPAATEALFANLLRTATAESQWANGLSVAYYGGQGLSAAIQRWFVDGGHVGAAPPGAPPLVVALSPVTAGWLALVTGFAIVGGAVGVLVRRPPPAITAALTLTTVGLLAPPGWHHYFAFLPFAQAVPIGVPAAPRLARMLAIGSFALCAAPLALLAVRADAYYACSAWGTTTLAALLAWGALVVLGALGARGRRA